MFTVSLVACIAINFLRIICAVCVSAKHKYTRKLHKFSANASLYDKAMNAGKDHRQCDCDCYTCSIKGFENIAKHFRENWGPVQPQWFQIHLLECEYDAA